MFYPQQLPQPRTQFQESSGKELVLNRVKQADIQVFMRLLSPIFETQFLLRMQQIHANQEPDAYVITDFGCGEGLMLDYLLQSMHETIKSYIGLRLKIEIYGCDIKVNLVAEFTKKITDRSKDYLKDVSLREAKQEDINGYSPPKSDLILASHSFYYTQAQWQDVNFDTNLLTRLMHQLKRLGCLSVILQSGQLTYIPNNQGGYLASNEVYEKLMYPLIEESYQPNQLPNTVVNAEEFEKRLNTYINQWEKHHEKSLTIVSDRTIAIIELGEINFTAINGCYPQNTAVTQLLNFYTRGHYEKLNGEAQLKLLDFIRKNCTLPNKNSVMCHVNRIFIITPQEFIPNDSLHYKHENVNKLPPACRL